MGLRHRRAVHHRERRALESVAVADGQLRIERDGIVNPMRAHEAARLGDGVLHVQAEKLDVASAVALDQTSEGGGLARARLAVGRLEAQHHDLLAHHLARVEGAPGVEYPDTKARRRGLGRRVTDGGDGQDHREQDRLHPFSSERGRGIDQPHAIIARAST